MGPFDQAQTPTQSPDDNPFASLPSPSGVPRITIPMGVRSANQAGAISSDENAPENVSQQVPYIAGADQHDNTVNIDPAMPKYDPDFVDKNGVMGDMHKYIKVHELEEKKLIDGGMSYEDAHKQATQIEEGQITQDGLPLDPYRKVIADVNKVTEKEHPAHPPGDLMQQPYAQNGDLSKINGGQAQPQQPMNDADVDATQKAIIRSSMANDNRLGGIVNIAQRFNTDTLQMLAPLMAGAQMQGTQEAAIGAMQMGDTDLEAKLEALGKEYMNDPTKATIPAQEFFYKLGLRPPQDPGSYMDEAGHVVWSTIATSLAVQYGAAAIAHEGMTVAGRAWTVGKGPAISHAIGMAVRKYSDAIAENPGMWITGEMMGGVGTSLGSDEAQDYATSHGAGPTERMAAGATGAMAGGLLAGTSSFVTVKIGNTAVRVSRWFMNKLANATDDIVTHFGASHNSPSLMRNQPEVAKALGLKKDPPQVNEDHLDAARAAEKDARQAGDNVVRARLQLDKAIPGTAEHKSAVFAMRASQEYEKEAVGKADDAWNMIPVEARGRLSRQQSAIRAQFADTSYPKEFAENQVQDELTLIDQQIANTRDGLSPQDKALGMAGQSQALSDGLWKAWAVAKGAMSKYWGRAPLKKTMPDSSMLKAIDGPTGILTKMRSDGFQTHQIPMDEIKALQERFALNTVREQGRPTLGWMKNFMTDLQEKAAQYYAAGNNILASNYVKLHGVMQSKIGEAFPDNIPLQQARAFTGKFFDYFTRGDLGRFMATNKDRGTRIDPEDVAAKMLRLPRAYRDTVGLVKWLGNNGVALTNIKDPMYTTAGQRMQLKQLQDAATQSIRQHAQDVFQQAENDPAKVARKLNDPTFNRRIQSLGEVSGEVKAAASELQDLATRRATIEKSALAKYMQRDPDKALDMVWTSSNPSNMAKALMDGTPGVGGFADDPKAMQGFTAGLIDRLVSSTGADPTEMLATLAGPRGRLMETVMGHSAYTRLEELVKRSKMLGDQEAEHSLAQKFKIKLIQMASLKALHLMPHWMEMGEGGQLQRAALVSSFAHDIAETVLAKLPIEQRLKMAISNPEVESALYSNLPQSRDEAKDLVKTLNRAIIFERSITGAYINELAYGNGPVREGVTDPSDSPLWWLNPDQAQASQTETGQPYGESASRMIHHDNLSNPPVRQPHTFLPVADNATSR
jgi:hypothetical protein